MKSFNFSNFSFPFLFLAILFFFASLPLQSAQADYDSCVESYENENYTKAVEECTPLADQGDKIAAYAVGMIYGKGIGGFDDVQKALPYLEVAANQGMGNAAYILGALYLTGETMPPDYEVAAKWLTLAVSKGSVQACDALAGMYLVGAGGLPKDQKKAFDLFLKSAEGGFAGAMFRLATMYEYGAGVPINKQEALKWYQKSADLGYESSINYLKSSRGVALRGPDAEGQARPVPPMQLVPEGYKSELTRLAERPQSDNQAIIDYLKPNIRELTPPYIYEMSKRMAATNQDEALVWFLVAHIRSTYDGNRCTDRSAGLTAVGWLLYVKDLLNLMAQDQEKTEEEFNQALDLEKTFPQDSSPLWICETGRAAMSATLSGRELTNWHHPESEWEKIRTESRLEAKIKLDEMLQEMRKDQY